MENKWIMVQNLLFLLVFTHFSSPSLPLSVASPHLSTSRPAAPARTSQPVFSAQRICPLQLAVAAQQLQLFGPLDMHQLMFPGVLGKDLDVRLHIRLHT